MFALIITLISIALVAALALATLYYGGPIFNQGADRANAAKVAAQGQQIMGAMELYRAEKGVYPNTLADLVSDEYLKSIPVAQAEDARALATALAAPGIWSLSSPGQPVIVLKPVSLATCMAYNKVNLGTSGVLQQARSTHLKQCIGTDVNNLMVVQPKAAADLVFVASNPAAVVQIGPVIATPLPPLSDKSASGWLDTTTVTPPPPPPPPPAPPSASYSLSALSFGSVPAGQTSVPRVLTVTNTGTGMFAFPATGIVAAAPYAIVSNTCASAQLSPGASCSVEVSFTPELVQAYSDASHALSLNTTTTALPSVALTGVGVDPGPSRSFSVTEAGQPVILGPGFDGWGTTGLVLQSETVVQKVLTITNTGFTNGAIRPVFGSYYRTEYVPSPWNTAITATSNCTTLVPGASCSVTVTYNPNLMPKEYTGPFGPGGVPGPGAGYHWLYLDKDTAGTGGTVPTVNGDGSSSSFGNASRYLTVQMNWWPAPPPSPALRVEIAGSLVLDEDSVRNLSLTVISRNGADITGMNPSPRSLYNVFVNSSVRGPSAYDWFEYWGANPFGGTSATFTAKPNSDNAHAIVSMTQLNSGSLRLRLYQPYELGNVSEVTLPLTGAAAPVWCATFPSAGPPAFEQPRVTVATVGPCN